MVKIAAWNVNSVKARLPNLLDWLGTADPDVVLLQETKCLEPAFPTLEIGDLGYNCAAVGQKSYNGVAVLSKFPLEVAERTLPGDETDEQARYLEAVVDAPGVPIRVASIYLPNGNPVDSDKYGYKLAWMERLHAHVRSLLLYEDLLVLGGDYNVAPDDRDLYDPAGWADDALCRIETRSRFRALVYLGLTEAFRALHREGHRYSFWDYQGGRWQKDEGLRIDHFLLSPQAADRLVACDIDRGPRGRDKASDHTPIICEITNLV